MTSPSPDPAPGSAGAGRSPPAGAAPRPRRRLAAKLAALAIGLLLAGLVAEAAIRVVAPQKLSGTWRIVAPRGYPVNRAGGESRHDGPGGPVVYRFNDLHLRGGPVAPAGARVLCLGDSFTFGWGLSEPDTYVGRLQSKADDRFGAGAVQILNGGCGGWGTDECVAFVEDYGEAVRPDAVLVFLNSWDVGRSLWGGPFVVKSVDPPLVEPRAATVSGSKLAGSLAQSATYQWLLEHSHLVQFVRGVAVRIESSRQLAAIRTETSDRLGAEATGAEASAAKTRADLARAMGTGLFRRLAAWCGSHRAALWVVTTGRREVVAEGAANLSDLEATVEFKKVAPALFAELKVPYFEIAPEVAKAVAADPRDLVFSDGHPTARGAANIADAAWPHLEPLLDGLRR